MSTPAERLEHQLFTAEEVRKIAFEVCEAPFDLSDDGRLGWMNEVLREYGISAWSPSQAPDPVWVKEAKHTILTLIADAAKAVSLDRIQSELDLPRVTCLRLLGGLEGDGKIVVVGAHGI